MKHRILGKLTTVICLTFAIHAQTSTLPFGQLIKRGEKAIADAEWDTAQELFQRAIQLAPASGAAHYGLGRVLEANDDTAAAITEYRKACKLAPADQKPAVALVNLLVRKNQFAEGLQEVESATKKWPRIAELHAAKGRAQFRLGKHMDATLSYMEAVLMAGQAAPLYLDQLATELLAINDRRGALGALQAKAQHMDLNAAERLRIAELLFSLDRQPEAIAEMEKSRDLASDPSSWRKYAALLAKVGSTDKAAAVYEQLQAAGHMDAAWRSDLLELYKKQGNWKAVDGFCIQGGRSFFSNCSEVFRMQVEADRTEEALATYQKLNAAGFHVADGSKQLFNLLMKRAMWKEAGEVCRLSQRASCDEVVVEALKAGNPNAAMEVERDTRFGFDGQVRYLGLAEKLLAQDRFKETAFLAHRIENAGPSGDYKGAVLNLAAKESKLLPLLVELQKHEPGVTINELHFLPRNEVLKAVYTGALQAKAKETSWLKSGDCEYAYMGQTELKIPATSRIELAHTDIRMCDDKLEFLPIQYEGSVWLIFALHLDFALPEAPAALRELPKERLQDVLARSRPAPLQRSIGSGGGGGSRQGVDDEYALGLRMHNTVMSENVRFDDPEAQKAGSTAFNLLMRTSTASASPANFELTLLKNDVLNAYSYAGGHIYVNSGMLPVIGKNTGMWAAVLGHEAGHVVAHHHYKAYLRYMEAKLLQDDLARRAAMGDKWASWAWLASKGASKLANMKLGRDDEIEADALGLMMMAEAGIHPDFSLHLMRRMKANTGDASKLATFFSSDHPRWQTREERVMRSYNAAVRTFETRWPDVASSPGGLPPVTIVVPDPVVKQLKDEGKCMIEVPLAIRHARNEHYTFGLEFYLNGKNIGSLNTDQDILVGSGDFTKTYQFPISASQIPGGKRNVSVVAMVKQDGKLIEETGTVKVSLPKAK